MLGLLALGLTAIMIFTLVKNALLGKQISKDDTFAGSIELMLPITTTSEFHLEAWQNFLKTSLFIPGQVKVHLLVDGHHSQLQLWQDQKSSLPFLEIHTFAMRPEHVEPVSWMLDQMSSKVQGQIVIIGDSQLVPTAHVFLSIAKTIVEKKRSYFIVPQTMKLNVLGEAVAVLNPTLAFTSFFGPQKWRTNFAHPLLGASQGWMAMDLAVFKDLDFKTIKPLNWKETISRQWETKRKTYHLAFGEKHLLRSYPEDFKGLTLNLKKQWEVLWNKRDKMSFFLFAVSIFIWSFPVVCLMTHPFWAIASFLLLILFRFFSKIVYQESWGSIFLHAIGCVFWIGTFFWFVTELVQGKYLKKSTQGMS